jgi:hypothetical protein
MEKIATNPAMNSIKKDETTAKPAPGPIYAYAGLTKNI